MIKSQSIHFLPVRSVKNKRGSNMKSQGAGFANAKHRDVGSGILGGEMRTHEDPLWIRRERDLYLRLLELGQRSEIAPFLREALAIVVDMSAASCGYLELYDDVSVGPPRWSLAQGCSESEVHDIRELISRGIIAHALATGKTVHTACAMDDERFSEQSSVRNQNIKAVLCVAVGAPPVGVVYLQGRNDGRVFSDDARRIAELFARHVAPLASSLLARANHDLELDRTRAIRETLRADAMVGRSEAMAGLLHQAALAVPLHVNVLITGPTGSGKSMLARVIVESGARASKPFVELNCAALPEGLLESELSGTSPGARSTAAHDLQGKISAAQGGTLLLDEVSELSLPAQAKLLQLLQLHERRHAREGPSVRVIATTSTHLAERVAHKHFRGDLFHRLEVMPIEVPSLADRREDISPLAQHFCRQACERHHLSKLTLSPWAVRAAEVADWPGNVRQLSNVVERAVIRAAGEGTSIVTARHLSGQRHAPKDPDFESLHDATREFQRRYVHEVLEAEDWNVRKAARRLEIARSDLQALIALFGLRSPDEDGQRSA
jgi:Nif-specific regulatory protein